MARSRKRAVQRVPPLLKSVARAVANGHGTNFAPSDLQAAVTELANIASLSVLARGLVASDELRSAVDAVAKRHLKRATAERQLTRALRKVSDRQLRNAIEIAHAQVLDLSELAHYYAGLTSGLTMVELGRR